MKIKSDKFGKKCAYLTEGEEYEVITEGSGKSMYVIIDDTRRTTPIRVAKQLPSAHTNSIWYVVNEEANREISYQELEEKIREGEHLVLKVTKEQNIKVQELWFSLGKTWRDGSGGVRLYGTDVVGLPIYLYLRDTLTWSPDLRNPTDIYTLTQEQQITGFNTQQEIWEYLINGGEVISAVGVRYKFVDDVLCKRYPDNIYRPWVSALHRVSTYKPYIKPKWYDNIPEQGILCWVWDTLDDIKDVGIIHSIEKDQEGKPTQYLDNHSRCPWDNAIPVTEEEVKKYVYKEQ